ncbi:MAG: lysophospholipid acyltransferase family protein [Eubacteriales bacterium]|nr:lysophospholipid acyltransferase family protein [Eubacteriales bacterium]
MEKSKERLEILAKIDELEKNKLWDISPENDPETKELKPNKVDYLNKKLSSKIATLIANRMGTNYFEKMLKSKQMIIDKVVGIENYLAVDGGAIITCNHFHPCDNYAVYRAIRPYLNGRRLYKVIREGNYTNYPNPIGFFFRHCNTLPLSSNMETMKNFMYAMKTLLGRGEKILIYPEQALWWNYRKPRPCKDGAYKFAVNNGVPIIPMFITMTDSDILDPNGFFVQKYTINIMPAIYPNNDLDKKTNIANMKEQNYNACVKTYEDFYKVKLEYLQ